MFLSREIDIIIPKRTYVIFCIKVVAINRSYSTITQQSENDYVPQEPENLRFAHIIIFEYDLFNTTTFIQNLAYARFGIILHSFMSISRDRHIRQISYSYRSKPEILRVHPIYPFSFFLYSPFKGSNRLDYRHDSKQKLLMKAMVESIS